MNGNLKNNPINRIIKIIHDHNQEFYYTDGIIISHTYLKEKFYGSKIELNKWINILVGLEFIGELNQNNYHLNKTDLCYRGGIRYCVTSKGLLHFFNIDTKKEWHE